MLQEDVQGPRVYTNRQPVHIFVGTKAVQKIFVGAGSGSPVWQNTNPPAITGFSVSPSSIDLDTRASGNITFTLQVTGTTGQITKAQVYRIRDNVKIGAEFNAATGSNINTTVPNIPQPNQSTGYRLVAWNEGGASHQDLNLEVTKNPTITNLRRTNFIPARAGFSGAQFTFEAVITGLPRPSVVYLFGTGETATLPASDFSQGSNPYTWNLRFTVTRANANTTSLRLTATNNSGTAQLSLSSITD